MEDLSGTRFFSETDCDGEKPCSKIFSPVCGVRAGATNVTFTNECKLRNEVCTTRSVIKVRSLQMMQILYDC